MTTGFSSPETKAEKLVVEFHSLYKQMKGIRNGCLWLEFKKHLREGEETALQYAVTDGNLRRVPAALGRKQGMEYGFMGIMIEMANMILTGHSADIRPRKEYKKRNIEKEEHPCTITHPAEVKVTEESTKPTPKKKEEPKGSDFDTALEKLNARDLWALLGNAEKLFYEQK